MTCYSSRAFMRYRFGFCALKTLGGVSRTKCHRKRLGQTDRQTESNIPGSRDKYTSWSIVHVFGTACATIASYVAGTLNQ